jgi:hypothetical protein
MGVISENQAPSNLILTDRNGTLYGGKGSAAIPLDENGLVQLWEPLQSQTMMIFIH